MNIFGLSILELENILIENNFKKYNAVQILDWIYKKKIYDFDIMTNLSKDLIIFCKNTFTIDLLKCLHQEKNKDTSKYLFELYDKNCIETVLMRQKYGNSLCVSTQIGCNMDCAFCESGKLKKIRNLKSEEMVLQIISVEKLENIRIDSVVIMGIGEPFDNYDETIKFIETIINPKMIEIGQRKVTVSTCGIVPKIKEFADLKNQVNLAISLHAPNDKIRNSIMPISKAYPLRELMNAVDYYIKNTNRRVTIEYVMLDNINETVECAKELCLLLKGKLVYVNLIPYNPTSNFTYKRSGNFKLMKFYDILKKNNIEVTIRKEMGVGVSAACGQLRAQKEV